MIQDQPRLLFSPGPEDVEDVQAAPGLFSTADPARWAKVDEVIRRLSAGPDRNWRGLAAEELGVNPGVIAYRAEILHITWAGEGSRKKRNPKGVKMRSCLKCDRSFMSTGINNRKCPQCRTADAEILDIGNGHAGRRVNRANGGD